MKYFILAAAVLIVGSVFIAKKWKAGKAAEAEKVEPLPEPPPPLDTPAPPVMGAAELAKVLESAKDSDPRVRWEAIKLLLQSNVPQGDAIAQELLARDDDPAVRKSILSLLVQLRKGGAAGSVVRAFKDPEPEVRVNALQLMGSLGYYSAAGEVHRLTRDSDERVKLAALAALNQLQMRKNEDDARELERQRQAREELVRKLEAEAAERRQGGE